MKTQSIIAGSRGAALAKTALAIILLIAFITAIPWSGEAGQFKKKQKSTEEVTAMLAERLDLSAEQRALIQPIIAEKIEKQQKLMEQSKKAREEKQEAMRSAIKAIDQESAAGINSVLTREQIEKYSEIKERQRQKLEERRAEKSRHCDEQRGNWKSYN